MRFVPTRHRRPGHGPVVIMTMTVSKVHGPRCTAHTLCMILESKAEGVSLSEQLMKEAKDISNLASELGDQSAYSEKLGCR